MTMFCVEDSGISLRRVEQSFLKHACNIVAGLDNLWRESRQPLTIAPKNVHFYYDDP